MDLTLQAQAWIEADQRLELVTPASLGILTFRRRGDTDQPPDHVDRRNEAINASIAADGDVVITSTVIGGRYVLRLCVLNHTTGAEDVRYALERVASTVSQERPSRRPTDAGADRAARQGALAAHWQSARQVTPDDLREVPAFESVSDDAAYRFLGAARVERFADGEAVTERWALARTFYVVLEGRLSARVDGRDVNVLEAGDHFGEIAAIDWGRDFSYGRTATVVAVSPTTVLAFPAAALRELMADDTEVDRAMRRVAQARLVAR
jgi:hypothetical protein